MTGHSVMTGHISLGNRKVCLLVRALTLSSATASRQLLRSSRRVTPRQTASRQLALIVAIAGMEMITARHPNA